MENLSNEPLLENDIPKKQRSKFIRFIYDVLETLVLSVLLFVAINAVSARIRVDGHSMEPSFQSGEFVLVNKLAYKFGKPLYGDVIVFRYPRDPEQEYIKRIIGLSGDLVRIVDGSVYVNDQIINEPTNTTARNYQSEWQVPEDSLFVLGDNRSNSSDSREWGTVPMDYVIGKALVVYWPPEKWGLVHQPTTANAAP